MWREIIFRFHHLWLYSLMTTHYTYFEYFFNKPSSSLLKTLNVSLKCVSVSTSFVFSDMSKQKSWQNNWSLLICQEASDTLYCALQLFDLKIETWRAVINFVDHILSLRLCRVLPGSSHCILKILRETFLKVIFVSCLDDHPASNTAIFVPVKIIKCSFEKQL